MSKTTSSILFIIDYFPPHLGGLETMFDELTKRLSSSYRIGILTCRHDSSLPTYEKLGNIEVRRKGNSRTSFFRYALTKGYKVTKQFDLIHTTTYASAIPSKVISLLTHKPCVLTVHEVFGPLRKTCKPKQRIWYQLFETLIFIWYAHHQHIVAVSGYTKTCLSKRYGIPPKNTHIIYNGVDQDFRKKPAEHDNYFTIWKKNTLPDHAFVGLYSGHAGCTKGITELICALPAIHENNPDFVLVLNLFPGRHRDEYIQLIDKRYLGTAVYIFSGFTKQQLRSYIAGVDVVFVPSRSEGFGLIAAEVSAIGTPLITTKNGALPEVVSGKVTFLKDYSTMSFVSAVDNAKQGLRENIPQKTFHRDTTTSLYMNLYQKILEEKK